MDVLAPWPPALSLVNPVSGASFVIRYKAPMVISDSVVFTRKREKQVDWHPDVITATTNSLVCEAILLTGCDVEVQAPADHIARIWAETVLSLSAEGENVMQRPLAPRMDLNPEVYKQCQMLFRGARKDGSLAGVFLSNGSRIICKLLHVPVEGLEECEIRVRLNAALYTTKGAPNSL
jgi:hypothetical protein